MGSNNNKNKKKKARFKIFIYAILSIFLFAVVACAGVVLAIIQSSPQIDVNQILDVNQPSRLYDDKDVFMDNVATDEQRIVLPFKDMPQNLKDAFVSIEDERFYEHNGIDPKRILGALYKDIMNKIKRQKGLEGASTITQQLIRNTILTSEVTVKRKIQEMYLAIKLQDYLSKDQILEAYMNTINLGGQIHGVEAASEYYFDKKAKELNLLQCAFIAGIPQSPTTSYLSATYAKDPNFFINRTKTVLYKMYDNNKISKEQYDSLILALNNDIKPDNNIYEANKKISDLNSLSDTAKKNNDANSIKKYNDEIVKNQKIIDENKSKLSLSFKHVSKNQNNLNYEWFSIPVIEQVKKDLVKQYKYSDSDVQNLLMYGGLKIYTTMDKELQDYSQKIIDDDKNFGIKSSKDNKGTIEPQAAAVVMDYHNGEVKVIIGGRGIQPARSYNRAASDNFLRPSGSSIKPLTVYGPAIDTKIATAATVIEDSPLETAIGKKYMTNGVPYNPSNYDSEGFMGYVNLRRALTYSINLVAIKLEDQLGLNIGAAYAEKFGLKINDNDKHSIAALSLGQLSVSTQTGKLSGVNPLYMSAAYGTFGNEGKYTNPILYTKVVDKTGKTILQTEAKTHDVLSPQSAYIMYDLLKGPVNSPGGTAPNAKFSSMPAAGKTGTSDKKKDFWFSGLTPYYSGAVWIGNDYPTTYNTIFSSTSAGIWSKIMAEAHKKLSVKDIAEPSDIVRMSVCLDSGKLPEKACTIDPRGDRTYTEMFIRGTVPTDSCDIHVIAEVNKITGKLASKFTPFFMKEAKVFIKRDYTPSTYLGDQQYVLPKELDDSKPIENDNNATDPPKDNEDNEDDGNEQTDLDTTDNTNTNKDTTTNNTNKDTTTNNKNSH